MFDASVELAAELRRAILLRDVQLKKVASSSSKGLEKRHQKRLLSFLEANVLTLRSALEASLEQAEIGRAFRKPERPIDFSNKPDRRN